MDDGALTSLLQRLADAVHRRQSGRCRQLVEDLVESMETAADVDYSKLSEAAAVVVAAAHVTDQWNRAVEMLSRVKAHAEHGQQQDWLKDEVDLHLGYALMCSRECDRGLALLEALVMRKPMRSVLTRVHAMSSSEMLQSQCSQLQTRLDELSERTRSQ